MYSRILDLDETLKRKSLFLLGPRQTGKSTLLKSKYPDALYINLLLNKEFQIYINNPSKLSEVVLYHFQENKQKLVIIDEIQKIPALLDEVHQLIEQEKSIRFILTGSSARKLKRSGANLLGGRASMYYLFPLCYPELGKNAFNKWLKRIEIGALPSVINSTDSFSDLRDYVGLYLKEEIQLEGLTRSIQNFSRFLDFAAFCNAEQVNYTSVGQDAQLSPSTIRDYFEILSDTLIGHSLPAFLQTQKRKAVTTAKFYLFDCGVTNAIIGRTSVAKGTVEYGKQLEQGLFIEIKAYLNYTQSTKKLEYWRSTSQFEIDFLVYSNLSDIVAIEVKSSVNPGPKDYKGFFALEEERKLKRKIVVCHTAVNRKTKDGVEVISIETFLKQLWAKKLF